jgi:phosphatidate cytidylyltransferase
MTAFWSRIAIAVAALPAVLGLVYLGGWWLFGLAAFAALLALHEYYRTVRSLRPLVLAGYCGTLAALIGARLGGVDWMMAGFLLTLPLAFGLHGVSRTRSSATVAIASTVLGAGWIGLGLGHVLLLRRLDPDDDGLLAAFTVLLAVWAADTVAYFAGRLVGRHKLAPTISPGKTWEGFVAGTLAAIAVSFFALYRQGFMDGWRSLALGATIALAGAVGDLFASTLKRDIGVKDFGRILAGHGGMLDRIDALLFAAVASFYVIQALERS